jgi:hypothetical protein
MSGHDNNSVRQYNQSQTGQVVGLSDDKWATLDIRQYGPRVMCVWEREVKIQHWALLHLHQFVMLFYATSFFVYKDRNIFYINSSYSHNVIWYFISVAY